MIREEDSPWQSVRRWTTGVKVVKKPSRSWFASSLWPVELIGRFPSCVSAHVSWKTPCHEGLRTAFHDCILALAAATFLPSFSMAGTPERLP
jgi:hypothetical protein